MSGSIASSKANPRSANPNDADQQTPLLWILSRVYPGTRQQWQRDFSKLASSPRLSIVFTPNPEQIELASRDAGFFQALQQADVLLPDGSGVVWASRRLRGRAQERITGRETVAQWLSGDLAGLPRTLLLGGRGTTAETVARGIDPTGEKVRGLAGFARVESPTSQETQQVWQLITTWKPAVIFVGFGAPKQERWILDNRTLLESAGVRVAMAVGGAFDVLSGRLALPPAWIVRGNLEWLYRLWQQPSRWRRQLRLLSFVGRVLSSRR